MARSKKPRKVYRPPVCRVTARVKDCLLFERVVADNRPYTSERIAEISAARWTELHRISTGKGTLQDLDQMAIAYNVTKILAEKVGRECSDVCHAATNALLNAKTRYTRTGRIGLDGEGLQRVRELLDLHDALLEHMKPLNYRAAIIEANRRMKAGEIIREITE